MPKSFAKAELEEALMKRSKENTPPENEEVTDEEEAQDALGTIADALVGIEKHLFALVYLAITGAVEKTGIGYVAEVFNAIYDDSDPFAPENMPQPIVPEENDGTTAPAPVNENPSPA